MKNYIAYFRVSTQKQGNSGLGLDAQTAAVAQFTGNCTNCVLATYQDIESGKNDDRPELLKAIAQAKQTGSTLLIAKLDRLSRNAAFILTLKDTGVNFVCVDMPEANALTIGIMAIFAQQEREMISKRTKEALKAKKERTGEWRKGKITAETHAKGQQAIKNKAANNQNTTRARNYAKALKSQGMTLQEIADRLNAEKFCTATGKAYHRTSVNRLIA
jgi:DNA invertase Pin-like site-specific DNA recombinase